jgi:phosphatidate cytidylyltransferase
MKNLATRVLIAIIAIPILVNIVLFGRFVLVGFVSLLTVLGFYEFLRMTQTRIRIFPQIILFVWLPASNWLVYLYGEPMLLYSLLIGFAITTFSAIFRKDVALSSTRVVYTVFAVVYLSLFNFLILIREFDVLRSLNYRDAGVWIVFAFAVIWVCDTAAYFVGSAIGRKRMSPVVSPKKSWEGFDAGLVFGTLTGLIFSQIALREVSNEQMVLAAFAISLVGQFGDLVESVFKRRFGVKDSSTIIPGHGGVLDRFDSLLFALPVLYGVMRLVVYSAA